MSSETHKNLYRTIFISDIHIGCRDSQLNKLLHFIKNSKSEKIILVGDIIDLWMGKRIRICSDAMTVIRKLIKRSQNGTEITYIPGNHDEILRALIHEEHDNIIIQDRLEYTTLKGKKYLVIHGDQFDRIILRTKWLAMLGASCYDFMVHINRGIAWIYRILGRKPRSLSVYIRNKVKLASKFISNFENALITVAKQHSFDGVITGHIHTPADKMIDGIHYLNCGDWLEHCSAIVETSEGDLQLLIERDGTMVKTKRAT